VILGDFNRPVAKMKEWAKKHNLIVNRPEKEEGWYTRSQKYKEEVHKSELDYIISSQ
jgi:hypothetical protein